MSAKEQNRNNNKHLKDYSNHNPNDLSHDEQFNQIVNMREFRD